MRIRLEHNGTAFEYQRRPIRKSHFRALCGLAAGSLYVGMMLGVAALCGIFGVVAVCIATFFVVLVVMLNMEL